MAKTNFSSSRLTQLRMRILAQLAFIPVLDLASKPKALVKEYERIQPRIDRLDYPKFVVVRTTDAEGTLESVKTYSAQDFLRMEANLLAEATKIRTKKFVGSFSMLSHAEFEDGSKIDVELDR